MRGRSLEQPYFADAPYTQADILIAAAELIREDEEVAG